MDRFPPGEFGTEQNRRAGDRVKKGDFVYVRLEVFKVVAGSEIVGCVMRDPEIEGAFQHFPIYRSAIICIEPEAMIAEDGQVLPAV